MEENIIVKYTKMILVVLFITIVNCSVHAQIVATDSANNIKVDSLYFKSEALFKCNIKLPKNFNPNTTHTLVIGLHGGGGTPETFINIWNNIAGVDFIYAAPQGPYSILFKKLGNEWSLWSSPDLKIRAQAADLVDDYLADLVKELKEQYAINDIYLFGFSQGAIFTYIAGIKNHQLYKGIIVFSGAGIFEPLGREQFAPNWLEEKYLEPAKSLRVFISHGTEDQAAKYELGVKSQEVLTGYGYNVTFHSFEGGHTIDSKILKLALEWINK